MKPITAIAHELVSGDRNDAYGHPAEDFTRVGRLWAAVLELDEPIPAETVALMLVQLKVARLMHQPDHRDSAIDIAGYAECFDMIRQRLRGQR